MHEFFCKGRGVPGINEHKKIRTVIIGMGRMGRTRLEAMRRHGGYRILGVCDLQLSKASDAGTKAYKEWKACIDEERPEAVIVCTVNEAIPDVVCYALECGCHVFSEKPPGRCLADALKMQEASEAHGSQALKYGFNHRYHQSVIEAKALIDSGMLGDVVSARGVYGKAADYERDEWRNDISVSGGGILLDQGIHMLDLMRYFVGDFESVEGFTDNLVWKDSAIEDTAFVTMRTKDGRVATMNSSAIQWKHKFDLDITLTGGYIALNGLLTSTKSYGEEKVTYYRRDIEQRSGKMGNPTEYTMCFDEDFSWDLEMEEFYEAVANGRPISNGTSEDAVAVMRMVDKVYRLS